MCPGPGLVLEREERIRETKGRGPSRAMEPDLVAHHFLLVPNPYGLFLLLIHEEVNVCFQASSSTSELMLGFFLKADRQQQRVQVSVHDI